MQTSFSADVAWAVRGAAKTAIHPFRGLISKQMRRAHERFDRRSGILTSGNASRAELGLSADSHRYAPTPVRFFRSILRTLDLDEENTTLVDLGSGQGAGAHPCQ